MFVFGVIFTYVVVVTPLMRTMFVMDAGMITEIRWGPSVVHAILLGATQMTHMNVNIQVKLQLPMEGLFAIAVEKLPKISAMQNGWRRMMLDGTECEGGNCANMRWLFEIF